MSAILRIPVNSATQSRAFRPPENPLGVVKLGSANGCDPISWVKVQPRENYAIGSNSDLNTMTVSWIYKSLIFRHPSFFGLHFFLALVPDRDPLRHITLPLDRYRNRVSFHFDYDCDPDFDFDGASQKSVNYF